MDKSGTVKSLDVADTVRWMNRVKRLNSAVIKLEHEATSLYKTAWDDVPRRRSMHTAMEKLHEAHKQILDAYYGI